MKYKPTVEQQKKDLIVLLKLEMLNETEELEREADETD